MDLVLLWKLVYFSFIMKILSVSGLPIWLFHVNLSIYFIYIWLKSWVFVVILNSKKEGSYIYRLHFVTPGIPSKFTYHCIGFLQMCKSLKKAKALKFRITLWHVGYMWLFWSFSVLHHFFLFSRFPERITWEIKTINRKFSIGFKKR